MIHRQTDRQTDTDTDTDTNTDTDTTEAFHLNKITKANDLFWQCDCKEASSKGQQVMVVWDDHSWGNICTVVWQHMHYSMLMK